MVIQAVMLALQLLRTEVEVEEPALLEIGHLVLALLELAKLQDQVELESHRILQEPWYYLAEEGEEVSILEDLSYKLLVDPEAVVMVVPMVYRPALLVKHIPAVEAVLVVTTLLLLILL
jgi:hypothetical protein